MTIRYFKTQSPTVLAANKAIQQQKNELLEQVRVFEKLFDGKAVLSHSFTGFGFCGLKLHNFNNRPDNHLWTKPMKHNGFVSHPRGKAPKVADKVALEALNNNYMRNTPTIREVKYEPFYQELGTNWGEVMLSGIAFFEHNGFVFISTQLELKDCTEIVASEYATAAAAFKQGAAV